MPAIAALTINDGNSTPVAHTFSPASSTAGKTVFADRSATIASGYRTIVHEVRAPIGKDGAHRISIGYYNPTVASVDGVDQVVRASSAQVTLNLSQSSTLQERKDLLAYVANSLGLASMKQTVENIEQYY